MRTTDEPQPRAADGLDLAIEFFADDERVGVLRPHQDAAFGEIGGLAGAFAAAVAQRDAKIAGQAVVTAPVADLGLPQEDGEAGLQLLGKFQHLPAGSIDLRALIARAARGLLDFGRALRDGRDEMRGVAALTERPLVVETCCSVAPAIAPKSGRIVSIASRDLVHARNQGGGVRSAAPRSCA